MTGIIIILLSLFGIMFSLLVHSFVELTNYLLDQPGVFYFLSEKLCQDPLESFFGKQRMRGGHCDNPTVQAFLKGTMSLRVQGSMAVKPMRGNCRRGKENKKPLPCDDTPMPKRPRLSKYYSHHVII